MTTIYLSLNDVKLASALKDGPSMGTMCRGTWQFVTGEFVLVEGCNPELHEEHRSKVAVAVWYF
jgi:hypothetical protein